MREVTYLCTQIWWPSNKKAYHFQKKDNEAQLNLNSTVEDHICAAKNELKKLNLTGEQDIASVKNVNTHLNDRGV